jgi:aspartate/methionine/tyrosine aminotransferase
MPPAVSSLRLSDLSPGSVQSEIRAMSVECDRAGGVNLAQGVCDTGVPSPVMQAALDAITEGLNIYTRLDGIAPLRQAISSKLARYNGISADPDSQVLVASGATGAFYAACMALFNPGDEVLLFEPFYGYHLNTLRALRVDAVVVPLIAPITPAPGEPTHTPADLQGRGPREATGLPTQEPAAFEGRGPVGVPAELAHPPAVLEGHGFSRADNPAKKEGALAPEGSFPATVTRAPDWTIDFDRLRAAVTPRTRGLVINSPSNPCGKVFSRAELEALAALALEHDLFVITDEIYEYFLYDGEQHISFASLPGMAERTVTISGLSKTFSITGWRIGYLAADRRWMGAIGYFHDLIYVCAPSPFQHACAAGLLALPCTFYAALAAEYQAKRDRLCAALAGAGLAPSIPPGAYYVLADSTVIPGANAREKARHLLRQTGVAAVAGTAFFAEGRGEHLLRFCFAKRDEDLQRACTALRAL